MFIGSALVKQLVRENISHQVFIIGNFSTGALANLAGVSLGLEIRNADILDGKAMMHYCKGISVVFHFAAVASIEQSMKDPSHACEISLEGTKKMLSAQRRREVNRFIFASSSAVYGEAELFPTPESEMPHPCSPYAQQKMHAESMVCGFAEGGGPEGVCLRLFNVYGPGQKSTSSNLGVLSAFCRAALFGERPVIFGNGDQSRDFIFVDDVVRAFIEVAWPGKQELAGTRLLPQYLPVRAGDVCQSQADMAMIEKLGFRVHTDLRSGLSRRISWHKNLRTPSAKSGLKKS